MAYKAEQCASVFVKCRGCSVTMTVTTDSQEAAIRVLEFTREHDCHFRIPYDQNGFAKETYGVTYGHHRGEDATA